MCMYLFAHTYKISQLLLCMYVLKDTYTYKHAGSLMDTTYDMACLARERRRVALAMSQPRPLLLPLDPRPCKMVCTP